MNKDNNKIVFSYDLKTGELILEVGDNFESFSLEENNSGMKIKIKPKDKEEIDLEMANIESSDLHPDLKDLARYLQDLN